MVQYTLQQLAEKTESKLVGDGTVNISGANTLDAAKEGDITFLTNPKYKDALNITKASAVIIDEKMNIDSPIPCIKVDDAYFRFLQIFLLFNPQKTPAQPGIHPSAIIASSVEIGKNVSIGANVVIGENCKIGDNSIILHNCVLLNNVKVGANTLFYPLVSIRENCQIGDRVIIHNGAVIGSDGFGFAPHNDVYHKIPQVGIVIVEDDVEIGANCTIDRATMGKTIIRKGVKLDNLIHIAHNVEIGESTVIAAQTGISGSTKMGHHVMVGGQVGTVGHITIGDYAQLGAQSGISKSVPEKTMVFGSPARPIMRAKRIEAIVNQLPELSKKVKELENTIKELSSK